jgi:IclR family KDG regulon transcriptional repressor
VKVVVEPGGSTSLHSTALGKVLLAFQDDSYIEEFLNKAPLTAFTKRSITNPDQLRNHLKQIREQRYAVNQGEHYDAIGAVGVPIIEKTGQVNLGVSLAYPWQFIQEDSIYINRLASLAVEIAAEISERIEHL